MYVLKKKQKKTSFILLCLKSEKMFKILFSPMTTNMEQLPRSCRWKQDIKYF